MLVSNYIGLLPVSFAVGRTEPGEGETQVVFEQTTIAGIDFAVIPLKAEDIDTGEEPALVPEEEGGDFSGLLAPTSARS